MTTETSIYEYAKQGLALSADKTAIWFYGKSITYRELFEKIDNVADNLYAMGVREGTVVTIHLPNCPQAVMAIYAVAKLGGICNMVHALMPRLGLADNMKFTESDFLITYKPDCLGIAKDELFVDISYHMGFVYKTGYRLKSKDKRPKNAKAFESLECSASAKAVIPDQTELTGKCVAYFSSSGTTGEPKTVMHCHKALNNSAQNMIDYFGWHVFINETVLSELPYFHGFGLIGNLHVVLTGGAKLVQLARWDPDFASKIIDSHSVTLMAGVPKVYSDLLLSSFVGSSLRQCFIAGDHIPTEIKNKINAHLHKNCTFEAYGMTEAVAACCACNEVHDRVDTSGYPLPNCQLAAYINNELSRVGEGELLVKTNTMMMGYLKNSNDVSYITVNGDKWLKTGDYGSIDEDGYVICKGRLKDIIIHKGYAIAPSEVETVLNRANGVMESCVIGVWDEKDTTQNIVAFIVSDKNDVDELKLYCEKYLPRYSIPAEFKFIEKLPRNRMSKIDRNELISMI